MAKHSLTSVWTRAFQRSLNTVTRAQVRAGTQAVKSALRPVVEKRKPPPGDGEWIMGMAMAASGARGYRLYRPPGVRFSERLPLVVMLHGCGQDAKSFALSTRMNRIAARERFLVLYPEQDRRAHPQGCWNWYETRSGRAYGEAAIIAAAVDQVSLLYPVDRQRIALAGLSAGASMAALLATRFPERFKAVVMHSGVPPGMAHSSATALGAMGGRRSAVASPALPAEGLWPPLMVIHGGSDPIVSSHNAQAAAQAWADAAGARTGASRRVQRGQRHEMTVTDYKLRGRTVATLCEIGELGHAWSGGAAQQPYSDSRGPDASRMAWSFIARQFAAR